MRGTKVICVAGAIVALAGCEQQQYVWMPPSGGSSVTFAQQSAQCRLFAEGNQPGYAVVGSQQFVTSYALGAAIGAAVRQQNDFNNCMEAAGWTQQPASSAGETAQAEAEQASAKRVEAVQRLAKAECPRELNAVRANPSQQTAAAFDACMAQHDPNYETYDQAQAECQANPRPFCMQSKGF